MCRFLLRLACLVGGSLCCGDVLVWAVDDALALLSHWVLLGMACHSYLDVDVAIPAFACLVFGLPSWIHFSDSSHKSGNAEGSRNPERVIKFHGRLGC